MKEYITLIQNPREFFKSVAKEKISRTLKKTVPVILILYIMQTLLIYFEQKEIYEKLQSAVQSTLLREHFVGFYLNHILIFNLLIGIIVLPLSIILSAYLLYLSLKFLKTGSSFSQNIKILIYTTVPLYFFSVIGYTIRFLIKIILLKTILFVIIVGGSFILSIFLIVKGLSEIYKISTGKAVGAYFLQFGLILGTMLALIIIVIILVLIIALLFKGFK